MSLGSAVRSQSRTPFGVLHPAHTATYIAGIRDANAAGGYAVFVTTDGKLGTINVPSAARFKDEIRAMDKTSEAILALKTVTFCYKKELDPNRVPQFGLVAEEVEKTAPDLVKRDHNGNLETVRYDGVRCCSMNSSKSIVKLSKWKRPSHASKKRSKPLLRACKG